MRHKRLKLSAVLLLGLGLTGLQAQESVNATGGNASGSGGSVSYSVGQVVTSHTQGQMVLWHRECSNPSKFPWYRTSGIIPLAFRLQPTRTQLS